MQEIPGNLGQQRQAKRARNRWNAAHMGGVGVGLRPARHGQRQARGEEHRCAQGNAAHQRILSAIFHRPDALFGQQQVGADDHEDDGAPREHQGEHTPKRHHQGIEVREWESDDPGAALYPAKDRLSYRARALRRAPRGDGDRGDHQPGKQQAGERARQQPGDAQRKRHNTGEGQAGAVNARYLTPRPPLHTMKRGRDGRVRYTVWFRWRNG